MVSYVTHMTRQCQKLRWVVVLVVNINYIVHTLAMVEKRENVGLALKGTRAIG